MTAQIFINFLKKNLVPWHKRKSWESAKTDFMHDNAPSHAAMLTITYVESVFAKFSNIIQRPSCSPDLNPIENFWSILKRKLYSSGKQFASKKYLKDAILTAVDDVFADEIKILTSSFYRRLISDIGYQSG